MLKGRAGVRLKIWCMTMKDKKQAELCPVAKSIEAEAARELG